MTAGESLLVDTNVLLAATDRSRIEHARAQQLFGRCRSAGLHPTWCGQVMREYLVVATRPIAANGLGLSLTDALENVVRFRRHMVLLDETEQVALTLLKLVRDPETTGKRVHDANLAAVALTHGVPAIVTLDAGGFAAYRGVKMLNLDQLWAETIA